MRSGFDVRPVGQLHLVHAALVMRAPSARVVLGEPGPINDQLTLNRSIDDQLTT